MWALRRTSIPLRSRGSSVGASRACCIKLTPSTVVEEDGASIFESPERTYNRYFSMKTFYQTRHASLHYNVISRQLSSQADASSTKDENDLEDGYPELETSAENTQDNNEKDELLPESELSDDDEDEELQNELELSETEIDPAEKKSRERRFHSELFSAIVKSPGLSVHSVLEKGVEEGKELTRSEVTLVMFQLRKRRMYRRALQLSEWLEGKKQLDFVERDYASRVDLIAKVHGLHKAEQYLEKIPKSFRGEVIYRTLLANAVCLINVGKSEEIFNKMKDLEFPLTAFACNQLLLLYKRSDKKKIADVLLLMEKENVKPSAFTYRILIDSKGVSNDIAGMDQIVATMKADGIEPDFHTQKILARHYASAGLKEKAEAVLKEMGGGNLEKCMWVRRAVLPIYGELGMADEVKRIWKLCESNPRLEECVAAIQAWGKLNKIKEAEAVFEKMSNKWTKLSPKHYSVLLEVYANHKELQKGKDLFKQMADSGCRIIPRTLDALVKLYVQSGEVEKADSVLQKAIVQSQMKPMLDTFIAIMDQYAKRGDIHNSEKIFFRMRQAGYTARYRQFQTLIQAYVNAKKPAYGIRERMKADNMFPNRALASQLAQIDAFRKTSVSDLLE